MINKQGNPDKLTWKMIAVFVVITVAWLASFFAMSYSFGRPENIGTAGDLFGAIGSLFSGWAFVGVLWAILLQQRSLQIQHDDFKATLDEMKQAREAHEESAETVRLQTRASILTTLIEAPLQIQPQWFNVEHVKKQIADFVPNIEELQRIHDLLREDTDKKVEPSSELT